MGIGNVYLDMKMYNKSLEYYFKSLDLSIKQSDSVSTSYLYTNISGTYRAMKDSVNHFLYLKKSQKIKEILNDEYGLVYTYNGLCKAYADKKSIDSALIFGRKSVALAQKQNNAEFISGSLFAIGYAYAQNDYADSAYYYINKALGIAKEINALSKMHDMTRFLSKVYEANKDYKNALSCLRQFVVYNDSLFNIGMRQTKQELQTKYDTERIEKGNVLLTEQDKKKQIIIYAVIAGLVLITFLLVVLFNRFKLKKRAAAILEKQNKEIEEQKTIIEEKQKEILDSINYAKHIQQAILATLEEIQKIFTKSFLFYKPKDIVAGDFYFYEEHNGYYFIAAADCTGHGVPGAMVSVVCSNALNRFVKEFELTDPGKILDKTRELVYETFKKSGGNVKDGMDISLLVVSKDELRKPIKKIEWAGANNPLWYIQDEEIKEITADKQPIGKTDHPKPFTTHQLELNNALVLLFTDGYADQFGGPAGKKFKYAQLKELLLAMQDKQMPEQREILLQKFSEWMSGMEQIDDVCIIGLRV